MKERGGENKQKKKLFFFGERMGAFWNFFVPFFFLFSYLPFLLLVRSVHSMDVESTSR